MLSDLKKLLSFLQSDQEGQTIKKNGLLFAVILVAAILINRFALSSLIVKDVAVRLEQSRILMLSESSVYDPEVHEYLKNQQLDKGYSVAEGDFDYESPVFNLLFLYPLTFLPGAEWAAAVVLTFNQIALFLSIHLMLGMKNVKMRRVTKILFYALFFVPVFAINAIFDASPRVITLLMLVSSLHFDSKNKRILSGIMLGVGILLCMDMFIVAAMVFAIMLKRNRISNIIWSIISISLIILFSLIFERTWILNWLKTLFLSPSRFPFLTYAGVLAQKYQTAISRIIIIVPILLISWVILEIWRSGANSDLESLWLVSIGGIVNHLMMISLYSSPAISLFFPLAMLAIVWIERFKHRQQLIFLGVLFGIVLIPTLLTYMIESFSTGTGGLVTTGLLIMILTINLYWSKNWIIQQANLTKTRDAGSLI